MAKLVFLYKTESNSEAPPTEAASKKSKLDLHVLIESKYSKIFPFTFSGLVSFVFNNNTLSFIYHTFFFYHTSKQLTPFHRDYKIYLCCYRARTRGGVAFDG